MLRITKIKQTKALSEARQKLKGRHGQSTVEFALITCAFLALLVGCGVLWRAFDEGLFVDHATKSASHHLDLVYPGAIRDVLLY